MILNLTPLERWLLAQGYREQTVELTLRAVRQVARWSAEGRPLPPRLRPEARRVLDYLDTPQGAEDALGALRDVLEPLAQAPALDPRQRRLAGRRRRKASATSLADSEWQRLLHEIEQDPSPEAAVLDVLASTGLRIGDVLPVARERLRAAMETRRLRLVTKGGDERTVDLDGAPDAWARLWAAWSAPGAGRATLALLVAPSGDGSTDSHGGAYAAVARKLRVLATRAGLTGRVHPHRLRRTVGVQALRVTEDTVAVQQLLGHRAHQTTLGYLDEARPERVAQLQREIRSRFTT